MDLVRNIQDPNAASKLLVDHALARFSTDNLSCMIVRFDKDALIDHQKGKDSLIGVEGDQTGTANKPSEAEKIVTTTKQKIAEGAAPAVGVSASNSGRGHDNTPIDGADAGFIPTTLEGPVEEEPSSMSDDSPEVTPDGSVATMDTESPEVSPSKS